MNMSINNSSFKYFCVVSFLKLRFYSLNCLVTDFRDFNSENRNAACVSKLDEYGNYWVLINPFWICLRIARYL